MIRIVGSQVPDCSIRKNKTPRCICNTSIKIFLYVTRVCSHVVPSEGVP